MIAGNYVELAEQFIESYIRNDPMLDHRTTIVCNGAPPSLETKGLFASLPGLKFITHDNSGFDIGSFQKASSESSADMIVFFGASAYVKGRGWLFRMAQSFSKHGEAQYGSMGNRGVPHVNVHAHLRTTGIWCSPKLFNSYPIKVTDPSQRFPFEHGPNCFTNWCRNNGLKNWLVTHSGEWLWDHWDMVPNGFHSGDQSDLLSGDRLCRPPYYHTPWIKRKKDAGRTT